MRALLSLLLLLLMAVLAHANSYLFTLQQKVAASKAVLRISLTEATTVKAAKAARRERRVLLIIQSP